MRQTKSLPPTSVFPIRRVFAGRRYATSTTKLFRDCSHSIIFKLPYLPGPQVAPTTGRKCPGRPGRLRHAELMRLPTMSCGIATCLNRAIGTAGLAPAGWRPCRLLRCPWFFLIASFQLSFKFRDALDIELSFSGSQFSSSSHLLRLLSGERGPPLERKRCFQLEL